MEQIARFKRVYLSGAIIAFLALSACQTASGTFCAIAQPQRPSVAEIEAMSPERAAAVLAHNQRGVALCGWRP